VGASSSCGSGGEPQSRQPPLEEARASGDAPAAPKEAPDRGSRPADGREAESRLDLRLRLRLDSGRQPVEVPHPGGRVHPAVPRHRSRAQHEGPARPGDPGQGHRRTRGSGIRPERQRARVHRHGSRSLVEGPGHRNPLHRSGKALAERLRRELQRPVPRGVPGLVLRQQGGHAVFHPEFLAFCSHWGVRPRACQPYRARTKGKVESGVGYVKGNALGNPVFTDDAALDRHLAEWMREVADQRLHGTTHERPAERFDRAERSALTPVGTHPSYLRQRRFVRKVAVDARVDVDTNRYSVPPAFLGETVEVLIEADSLQIHWRDRIIAEHTVASGRYREVVDPSHVGPLAHSSLKLGPSTGILRDMSVYERAAGGEA